MRINYSFPRDYSSALTSKNTGALKKLIRRALRTKPPEGYFAGHKGGKPSTPYEVLNSAVWRTFEAGQVEHGRLFLAAGLPVDLLMRDVHGIAPRVPWTPLDVTIMPLDGDERGKLQLTKMLLAAGANPQRNIWNDGGPVTTPASYVQTLEVARAFWEFGVPVEAFRSLPQEVWARI